MAWRKWVVRSLVFTVAGALAVALLAYQHWTAPEVVRQLVLERIGEHLPGALVSLEHAQLRILGGISFRDLSLTRRDDPDQIVFAHVPSGTIFHDKEQLLNGKLAIRKIEWYHPRLRIIRRRDGKWNLAGVLAPPDPNVPVPTIELQQATLVFEDQASGAPPLEAKGVDLTLVNDPLPTMVFRGSGSTALVGALQATGTWGRFSNDFTASVQLNQFPIDGALIERVVAYCPEGAAHVRQLTGTGKLRADLRYQAASKHWSYDVTGQLTRGKLTHARLPFSLEDLQASIHWTDGQLTVRDCSARSGDMRIKLSGQAWKPAADADLDGELEIDNLAVGPDLFARLPPSLQTIRQHFDVHGGLDLTLKVQRRGGQLAEHCILHPKNLTGACSEFPYRLDRVTGTIEQEADAAQGLDHITVDLVGYSESLPVYIQGTLEGASPSALNLKIWANRVPLDAKLRAALEPDFEKKVVEPFHPSGFADIVANIQRPQGQSKCNNRYFLRFHDCGVHYAVFPYPIEQVSGTLEIGPESWEFRDFHGSHKGGEFRSHGGSIPTAHGKLMQIEITGDNILLDGELEASLQQQALKSAWKKLAPAGRMQFTAHVSHLENQADPDIAVMVVPRGCSVRPDFFPYELTDIQGKARYERHEIELVKLSAHHGPTVLTLEKGKVYLKPEGGLSVDLVDLVGNPVLPEADLLNALPPTLGKAVAFLQLRDPLALRTSMTLDLPTGSEHAPYIYWDGGLRLHDATVQAGVRLDHVTGLIFCRGMHQNQFGDVVGNFQLAEASIFGVPFRELHSQIVVKKEEPDVVQLPNFQARIFGGDVGGELRLAFGPTPRYLINLKASQVQLDEIGRYYQLGPKAELRGLAAAALFVEGQGTNLAGMQGQGSVDIPSGKMYNLPWLLDLIKLLNLHFPDGTAFDEARALFTIQGPVVSISKLDLLGHAVSLGGKGTVNLETRAIDMEFYSLLGRYGQMAPPPLKQMLPAVSRMLLKIKMQGQLGQTPRFEPVPILVGPIKEMLQPLGGRNHME
jgi:hypothetical protein